MTFRIASRSREFVTDFTLRKVEYISVNVNADSSNSANLACPESSYK